MTDQASGDTTTTIVSTRIICHCDEAYLPGQFTHVDGWWATPIENIEFCDGLSRQTCNPIFATTAPERVGAWRCPVGCLWRSLPAPNDQEPY